MPTIAWGIIVVWGALLGEPLLSLRKGPDPTVNRGHYKPEKVAYHSWSSSGSVNPSTGECTFTAFALVTREKLTRLRVDGVEQNLDWSWSWEVRAPEGRHATGTIEFLDPEGGAVVATHDIWARCFWRMEEW